MKKMNILIVEDEPIIAADLAFTLRNLGYSVFDPVGSGEEALEFLQQEQPDIILMDVNLDGDLDGVDTAHQINAANPVPIIFLTSNTDQATFSRAKLTQPHAFLSKPFREADLRSAIELAMSQRPQPTEKPQDEPEIHHDRIFLKVKDRMVKIMLDDILWAEADRYYSWIVAGEKKYLATLPLKKLAEQLPVSEFMRVSRSHLVNFKKVDELDDHYVFIGKEKFLVGKSYKEDVMKRFLKF